MSPEPAARVPAAWPFAARAAEPIEPVEPPMNEVAEEPTKEVAEARSSRSPSEVEAADQAAANLAEAQAELEASRARLARDAVREREADKLRLVTEMLPALDDLDRAIVAARLDDSVSPALVEGFEMVRARLERVLQGYGLERIEAVGHLFDPAVHEAIAIVPVGDAAQRGVVIDEVARGYRAGDRIVRAPLVRVGAAS